MSKARDKQTLARWRLVLGEYAENGLGGPSKEGLQAFDARCEAMDRHLDFLYGREKEARGHLRPSAERGAGLGPSQLTIPDWVQGVRELFPQDTIDVLEKHALEKYELNELVTDPDVLQNLKPSYELMKAVLSFQHLMKGPVLDTAGELVRRTIAEIQDKLRQEVRRSLCGKINRQERSSLKVARNFDWKRTVLANLKHYDPKRKQVVLEHLHFFSNNQRRLDWNIILAVDCSGSMMDSVIYSAIMAGIFHGLPSISCKIIAFDTEVVDLSDRVDDPTSVLFSVQLGGGTLIGKAMNYCESLVEHPDRTIVVLVTDFYEGGNPGMMLNAIQRMK
ncbi:MAG: VWA domain-containing protein, partial [Verrucomicrobiota bacterium]